MSSPETQPSSHPFCYVVVIGIFHANVQHTSKDSQDYCIQQIEFLWVQWLGVVPDYASGQQQVHLPEIGFVPDSDEFAFGFLDPLLVLQGCHLLPSFDDGRTINLLTIPQESITEARPSGKINDWTNYYVGIFVDYDMLMQFLGYGIAHKGQTNCIIPLDEVEEDDLEDNSEPYNAACTNCKQDVLPLISDAANAGIIDNTQDGNDNLNLSNNSKIDTNDRLDDFDDFDGCS